MEIELPPTGTEFWEWMGWVLWRRPGGWMGEGLGVTAYVGFNLLETAAWWALAVYAMIRYARFRRSWVELAYAGLFAVFGLTDALESQAVTPWLIVVKGLVLVNLVTARKYVVERCYPGARV